MAIGTAQYRDILPITRAIEPGEKHVPGVSYWSFYWHFVYVVEAVNGSEVTVRTPADQRIWHHRTPLDFRDRVFV